MAQKGQGGFAKKQAEEAAKRRAAERRRALITMLGIGALLVIVLTVALVLRSRNQPTAATGGNDSSTTTPGASTPTTGADTSFNYATTPGAPIPTTGDDIVISASYPDRCPGEGQLLSGDRPLAGVAVKNRNNRFTQAPDSMIDVGKCYEAVMMTDKGEIRFRLLTEGAPLTVNNFVFLATQGFYDGTTFHRVMKDFMAQGGDPTGTGSGGPGYRFADEVKTPYTFDRRGVLAMANSGPNTNGSQFFITFAPTAWLNGMHTIFGILVQGDDVLSQIRLRDPQRDAKPGDTLTRVDIYAYQP